MLLGSTTAAGSAANYMTPAEVEVRPLCGSLLLGRTAAVSEAFDGMLYGAACGVDEQSVRLRATAELIEHVAACVSAFEQPTVVARMAELDAPALAPSVFEQGLVMDPHADDVEQTWCRGRRLRDGATLYVPALMSFLRWQPPPGQRLFAWPDATGLAAARTAEAAWRHGLLEIIERHACMMAWRSPDTRVWRLPLGLVPRDFTADGLRIELYGLGEPPLPGTVLALLYEGDGERLTCGSACGAFDEETARHAVEEAWMLRWSMLRCATKLPGCPSAVRLRNGSGWPDDAPRTSFEHVLRAWHEGGRVREWFRGLAWTDAAWPRPAGPLAELVACAEVCLGAPVVAVDLRSSLAPDWHVWRVVAPHALRRESDHRRAHLSSPRLTPYGDLHREPHPYG